MVTHNAANQACQLVQLVKTLKHSNGYNPAQVEDQILCLAGASSENKDTTAVTKQ